jgi:hypothetical protein
VVGEGVDPPTIRGLVTARIVLAWGPRNTSDLALTEPGGVTRLWPVRPNLLFLKDPFRVEPMDAALPPERGADTEADLLPTRRRRCRGVP